MQLDNRRFSFFLIFPRFLHRICWQDTNVVVVACCETKHVNDI